MPSCLTAEHSADWCRYMTPYDIIIPVYNGFDVLTDCLESVRHHTAADHRVIVIDDASPDPRVWPLLQTYSDVPGFTVLQNAQNLGFVGTVNRGMAMSPDRSVILLNSDTVVTARWVEKMDSCARSRPMVGSVTALSNNATICSVPEWLIENPLPEGHTIDSFADLLEDVSMRLYPEIPTAVGFCMLITRAALQAVGLFDAEAFARGYGEENDWCMRALHAGWVHLCDDTTYIYHQGSVSFAGVKEEQVSANYPVLMARHPSYQDVVDDFIASNPLALIQHNLKLALGRRPLPRILYLLHNPIDSGRFGGTEFHVRFLVEGLIGQYAPFVGYVEDNYLVVDEFKPLPDGSLKKHSFAFELETDGYAQVLGRVLEVFAIDVVHVHHFLGHPHGEMFDALAGFEGPKLASLHDYYAACRNFNLLYKSQHYCGLTKNDFTCASCIRATQGWDLSELKEYRNDFDRGLRLFDTLIFPSNSVRDAYVRFYGLDPAKAEVVPHGLDVPDTPRPAARPSKPLKVAFIGSLVLIKGVETIRRLIADNRRNDVEWHLWGTPALEAADIAHGRLIYHGPYDRNDIVRLMTEEGVHVGLLPSICPETFSYALSEFYAAGIPVIGSTLGAIGDRISRDGTGWTLDPQDVPGILALVERLLDDPALLEERRRQADFSVSTNAQMCARYAQRYDSLLGAATSKGYIVP